MNRSVALPSGENVAALGQGTWNMAQSSRARADDVAALRAGIDLGMTLIDTAEMYGDGAVESLVGEAIAGMRDRVFLVSKVYPHNAGRKKIAVACDNSLKRLSTDRLDLYLLHWREDTKLEETVAGFEALTKAGKIRYWGVSNFDTADMDELITLQGGPTCATNQILYNLARRGPEWDLLPWHARHRMLVMAYSPIAQGRLSVPPALQRVAHAHDATPYQIALAWVLRRPDIIAIPKAGTLTHVRENHAALKIVLTDDDLAALDAAFPPPKRKRALDMI